MYSSNLYRLYYRAGQNIDKNSGIVFVFKQYFTMPQRNNYKNYMNFPGEVWRLWIIYNA